MTIQSFKQNCGPSNHNGKERERERKGGGALKPIESGLKESHQSIAMKEPHLNFDSEKQGGKMYETKS